jgi:hypothetical protein
MMLTVFPVRKQCQIHQVIIQTIMVFMVDMLSRGKLAAKLLLHKVAMLIDPMAIDFDKPVQDSIASVMSAATSLSFGSIILCLHSTRDVLHFDFAGWCEKRVCKASRTAARVPKSLTVFTSSRCNRVAALAACF